MCECVVVVCVVVMFVARVGVVYVWCCFCVCSVRA